MTTKLQDTAAMHAALNHALTHAAAEIEAGGQIPWADLEAAITLAIGHGIADQKDLDDIRARSLSIERLKTLLARVKERYGNPPKPPRIM